MKSGGPRIPARQGDPACLSGCSGYCGVCGSLRCEELPGDRGLGEGTAEARSVEVWQP